MGGPSREGHSDGAHLFGADLRKAVLQEAHLEEAILIGAHLQGAILHRAYLQEAMLIRSRLEGADLREAHLQRAHLFEANLQKAILMETHLENTKFLEAYMARADLQRAYLKGTDLQKAHLDSVNLAGAIYEPNPESLPLLWTLTSPANNLAKLVFYTTPAALVALREAFKKAGMRTQERQITYAIERNKMLLAWDPSWHTPGAEDMRPWLEKLSGKSESLFSYVWFELPSHYGMAPGRALWGLLGLIPIFALPYWMAIKHANRRSGLWMIVAEDRLASRSGKQKAVQLRPPMAKTWRNRLRGESRMLRTGLYFSLLSAFHLGWREFNVGTWITRMQPREYTLRATGWVRTVSGIQSLLSVYLLLALWVLTYFGRPFE
jgi:hypothetical protein